VFHLKGLLFYVLEYGRFDFGEILFNEKYMPTLLEP